MAAPNLINVTSVVPATFEKALTGSAADIIAAVTGSHAYLILSLFAANITATPYPVTIYRKKSGTSYEIAYQMTVPANSTISILDGTKLLLPDGESITGLSSGSSQIMVTGSYFDLS